MTEVDPEQPLPSNEEGFSAGSVLRGAREERGLTVSDVAQALKFSERQIVALEENRFSDLPRGQFVRGFIRSYARLVKLDPVRLLDRLDQVAPTQRAEVVAPENMGDAGPYVSLFNFRRIAVGGVLLTAFAIAAGYIWNQRKGTAGDALRERTEQIVLAPSASSAVEPVQAVISEATPPSINALPMGSSPVLERRLVFDFKDKSWLEVRDASNAIILTGEFPSGHHQEISGRAPFQLWVGNAPAVTVMLDQRSIDLQPYSREGVARLTAD